MGNTRIWRGLGLALCLMPAAAFATNGYFSHGYGSKAKGRGGAAIAVADDAIAGANNPAAFAVLGNRIDAGFEAFVPKRGASRAGGPLGAFDFEERSDRNLFIVPDFGASFRVSPEITIGGTVYGNGGLNTDYQKGNTANCPVVRTSGAGNPFCGEGPAGVNLEQLVIAPSVAMNLSKNHAVGISALIVYQRFYATGLQLFGDFGFSRDDTKLTNTGTSDSRGLGYRLGYLGRFGDLSVGLNYSPRINMTEFDEYAGLFAEQGDFDIPTNMGVGLAYQVTDKIMVAADYTRVKFSEVASVGNTSTNAGALCSGTAQNGNCLGDDTGPGFGWKDVKTMKLGVEYSPVKSLTLRMGYNKGNNPVTSENVTFNILAPGVIEKHYTVGGTLKIGEHAELTAHYMYAPRVTVKGTTAFSRVVPGVNSEESVDMYQRSLGVSLGLKY